MFMPTDLFATISCVSKSLLEIGRLVAEVRKQFIVRRDDKRMREIEQKAKDLRTGLREVARCAHVLSDYVEAHSEADKLYERCNKLSEEVSNFLNLLEKQDPAITDFVWHTEMHQRLAGIQTCLNSVAKMLTYDMNFFDQDDMNQLRDKSLRLQRSYDRLMAFYEAQDMGHIRQEVDDMNNDANIMRIKLHKGIEKAINALKSVGGEA